MTDDITSLRALAEKHPWTVRSAARMRQPLDGADAQALEGALCSTERERNEARAEVERQERHIKELQGKIDAEKSCCCSYDAPGDVCGVHSPALMDARAEVERLREVIRTIRARCVEMDDSDAVSETLDISSAALEDEP